MTVQPSSAPVVNMLQLASFFGANASNTYSVPIYQRDYAWARRETTDLLNDLIEFYDDKDDSYLLGQVIVAPGDSNYHWSLVDGQQRVTTLFLLYQAIYKLLQTRGAPALGNPEIDFTLTTLNNSLVKIRSTGGLEPRLRVAQDGTASVQAIQHGDVFPESSNITRKNIKRNYEIIRGRLNDEFPTIDDLKSFFEYLSNRVWLMRLELSSDKQALSVFEKINHRGLGLNSADLLKNLLFAEVPRQDYDVLSATWEQAAKDVFAVEIGAAATMESLMKALIAAKTGTSIPKSKVYDGWSDIFKADPTEVSTFADALPNKARNYKLLGTQKLPNGARADVLAGTKYFNAVQHYTVLLAGDHLDSSSFESLARVVEDRTVLSLLSGEKSQAYERLIPKWAKSVAALPANANDDEIFTASADALADAATRLTFLETAVSTFSYSNASERKKIRYILARLSRSIERFAGGASNSLAEYLATITGKDATNGIRGYDIEHVLPSSFPGLDTWDVDRDSRFVNSIGNLVLLYPSDNRRAGDSWPSEKAPDYASSKLLLTKSLCSPDDLGLANARVAKALALCHEHSGPSLENWDEESVSSRETLYQELLKREFIKSLRLENAETGN